MDEIKTLNNSVTSFMQAMAEKEKQMIHKNNGIITERVVYQCVMPRSNEFSFCPMCRRRAMRGNFEHWKDDLKNTLIYKRIKQLVQNTEKTGFITYEDRWFCSVCRKEMTVEEITSFYVGKSEIKSRIVDLTKIDLSDPNFLANF